MKLDQKLSKIVEKIKDKEIRGEIATKTRNESIK
jgi:hypothetical protein